jgi:hypothetical protein
MAPARGCTLGPVGGCVIGTPNTRANNTVDCHASKMPIRVLGPAGGLPSPTTVSPGALLIFQRAVLIRKARFWACKVDTTIQATIQDNGETRCEAYFGDKAVSGDENSQVWAENPNSPHLPSLQGHWAQAGSLDRHFVQRPTGGTGLF